MGDASELTLPILPVIGVGLIASALIFASTLVPGVVALRRAPVLEIGWRE